jgi:hypothetical protein
MCPKEAQMLVHIYLSTSAFERLVRLRLLGEFRPVDEPLTYNSERCYMDGLEITRLELSSPSPRSFEFALNKVHAGHVVDTGQRQVVSRLLLKVSGAVVLSTAASVAAAGRLAADGETYGLPERPDTLRLPILGAELDVFFTVAPNGTPILNLPLEHVPGGELLGDVPSFLDRLRGLALPFPVGPAFAELLVPGRSRVVNAGVAPVSDGIVIRLEFEPAGDDPSGTPARLQSWLEFFAGSVPSQLAGRDWAVELPTGPLGDRAARELDEQLSTPAVAKKFESSRAAWAVFRPHRPGFDLRKEGVLPSACSGLDIRASLDIESTFSVHAANMLRTSAEMDLDLDDWDSFKCTVLSLLNPLAGLITTVDQKLPWYSVPAVSIILPLAPIAFGLGVDDLIVREAVRRAQRAAAEKGAPAIQRTSLNTFFVDVTHDVSNPVTRDWMVIEAVRGVGDRLVLSGAFTAPDIHTLPRVRGRLTDGFRPWSKENRCASNSKWVTVATLSLGLEDAAGQRVARPVVPILYGIDVNLVDGCMVRVGDVTWRVINDRHGVYTGPATQVYWTGNPPGVFEIKLTHPREPFASAPHAFHIQLFTSVGVREFVIPAPPRLPRPPQTEEERIFEAAERISECYASSSVLAQIRALQVFWLPRPADDVSTGQHWQVLLWGVEPRRQVRVWNAETGELLAEAYGFPDGLTEVSLVLAPDRAVGAVQVTLDDTPVMSADEYARHVAKVTASQEELELAVSVRQTPLYQITKVPLEHTAHSVVPEAFQNRLVLLTDGAGGREQIDLDLADLNRPAARLMQRRAHPTPPLTVGHLRLLRSGLSDGVAVELVDPGLPAQEHTLVRYHERPWYDRGGVSGPYFAQLDPDGTTAHVYRRGFTQDATPREVRADDAVRR